MQQPDTQPTPHGTSELHQLAAKFAALHELAVATAGVLDVERLGALAVDRLTIVLAVDDVLIRSWDPDAGLLHCVASNDAKARIRPPIRPGEGVVGQAFVTRRPVVSNSYPSDRRRLPWARRAHAAAGVPLLVDDRAVGAIGVAHVAPRPITQEQIQFLQLLAAVVGPALESARLFGALERSATALREQEDQLRAIVDSSVDPILAIGGDGRITHSNPAANTMLGQAGLGSRLVDACASPEERSRLGRYIRQAIRLPDGSAPRTRLETMFRHPDGRTMWVEVAAGRYLRQGAPQLCLSFRDLSDRQEAVAARLDSEAKSAFLATMSHELRTPLNSVLGFAQLMEQPALPKLDAKRLRYVKNILDSGSHLLSLITDILDWSRLHAEGVDMTYEMVKVAEVAGAAVEQMRPLAESKGLRLECEVPAGVSVRADRRRLVQVLLNLLSNAIKFTPAGGSVSITATTAEMVQITVADTGVGIAPEDLLRIFEQFTQVQWGASRQYDGAGLGLTISRRLVELMGGTLTADSAEGRGSEFRVMLSAVD